MTNSISPAISVNEIDLTNVVPSVQSSTGAFVGNFQWGPVEAPVLINNEATLASVYGAPGPTNSVDFLSAAQFLSYSGRLYVNRVVTSSAKTANANGDNLLVKNENSYYSQVGNFKASGGIDTGVFVAKYPGSIGNSLAVSVCTASAGAFATWTYKANFEGAPSTSPWLAALNDSAGYTLKNDEVHVCVIDAEGKFSGVKGTVLERFAYLSVALGAKTNDGGNNYWVDVINNGSRYIRFGYKDTSATGIIGTYTNTSPNIGGATDYVSGTSWSNAEAYFKLSAGADSGTLTPIQVAVGFDSFEDTDILTLDLMIAPSMPTQVEQTAVVADLVSICASLRKDCVAVSSPDRAALLAGAGLIADPVTPSVTFAESVPASSYLVLDNNYLKVLDKYNDQFVWIPAASTTAGIMAATDLTQGPWYSPAGQKRGQYFGVVDIAYNATKTERDRLYSVGVNPVVSLPGRGITLYGDKTRENRPSAFNRINVRRLFLNIERAISAAARGVMFEFNDEFTRAEFVNIIEPYLREIKGRRGITDFVVQCDETNNTPAVVDRNELVASIFVKPARSINFVTLNFVAVRTGVNFEEVVGTV